MMKKGGQHKLKDWHMLWLHCMAGWNIVAYWGHNAHDCITMTRTHFT